MFKSASIAFAALAIAAPASAATMTQVEPNVVTYSAVLKPHSSVLLACKANQEPLDADVSTVKPYSLTVPHWRDGGEFRAWQVKGKRVASDRPSQIFGLGLLKFDSYGRSVNVEIICS